MAEAAVTFLLQQLTEVVREYSNLISGANSEFEQLKNELGLLKAFLKEAAAESSKHKYRLKEIEKQIKDVVYDVEDTIDICLTEAIEAKSKATRRSKYNIKRIIPGGANDITASLARNVKFIRENTVSPMFNEAKLTFTNTPIGDHSGNAEDPRTKVGTYQQITQNRVVGFEDEVLKITEYLLQETVQETAQGTVGKLDVIPIIGVPGQGKTTLTTMIYHDENIKLHFPVRIWVYISEKFDIRDMLVNILMTFHPSKNTSQMAEKELTDTVAKSLENVTFLLVLDDVWSKKAWDAIQQVLPLKNGKAKVLITSRDKKVGEHSTSIRPYHKLRFLTKEESWELLQYKVFENLEDCPTELRVTGEEIATKCDGVPLTLVVIGGILLDEIHRYLAPVLAETAWKAVSSNVSDALQNDEEHRIDSVVALSYDRLPDDLRDCFVYLGVFPEDYEIQVKMLLKLWVTEGFIQPKDDKSMEEVAEENLNDLMRRNLVKEDKTNHLGQVKTCRIHDMIRAFCKSKSNELGFFREMKRPKTGPFVLSDSESLHRLCLHSHLPDFLSEGPSAPRLRSFLCFCEKGAKLRLDCNTAIPDGFTKLRVLESQSISMQEFPTKITTLIHIRYLTLFIERLENIPEKIAQLWNLQSLVVNTKSVSITMKANIWRMIQLKHFKTNAAVTLDNKWKGEAGHNLQTLGRLSPESCTVPVFEKAKNLKMLAIYGKLAGIFKPDFLEKLSRLETLKLVNNFLYEEPAKDLLHSLSPSSYFPPNLKSLTLRNTSLNWEHMSTIAAIKTLEVLKLRDNAFVGVSWIVADYCFPSLQLLLIVNADLLIWEASTDAFKTLRFLVVQNCTNLNEIPKSVGQSLLKLDVERLKPSAIESAKNIAATKPKGKGKLAVEFELKLGAVSTANKGTS